MAVIQTAVDKLVKLVKERGKISIPEAAKTLGVSESVIEEWASFLQEQGILGVEYRLATGYLVGKKLTEKEKVQKLKQFKETQDLFTVRAETMLEKLEKHSKVIDDIEAEFSKLKKTIDTTKISKELKTLYDAEKEREDIKRRVAALEQKIKSNIEDIHKQLINEHKKYENILSKRKEIDKYLEIKHERLSLLRSRERSIEERIKKLSESLQKIKNTIKNENQEFSEIKERYNQLDKLEKKLSENIERHKKTILELENMAEKKDKEIINAQKEIVKKVKNAEKNLKKELQKGETKYKKIERVFKVKAKIDQLLEELEKEKSEMEKDLRYIIKTAKAFKSSFRLPLEKNIVILNKKMKKVEKTNKLFRQKSQRLLKLMKSL
ncbi:MAG: hypothetical protein J7K31_02095 [Candidatus Aenigmarchaeota archaeon]|nr:hypothetical protein [Candidatus Aenigmarchaeota archaeon]